MTRTKSGDSDDWFKLTESGFQGSQEDITGGKPSFGAYTQEDNPDGPGLQRERQFGGRNQDSEDADVADHVRGHALSQQPSVNPTWSPAPEEDPTGGVKDQRLLRELTGTPAGPFGPKGVVSKLRNKASRFLGKDGQPESSGTQGKN